MEILSDLQYSHIYRVSEQDTFNLTIELACTSGVNLLVCGNRLPFYDIAYALARRVGQRYETILKQQIFFSRAETCIQLVDFLTEMQADSLPLLVTDMLTHFYDEDDDPIDELFFECQVALERLSRDSLVFISANPRPPLERLGFVLSRITHKLDYPAFISITR